jgi:hypothetical protein
MFSKIKATIIRYRDFQFAASWAALTQLPNWLSRTKTFNSLDYEGSASPSLRVACATNERGEAVCYTPIENVWVVSGFAINPAASPEEAQQAGDAIDAEIEREAQQAGVTRLLIMVPATNSALVPEGLDELKGVRVFERKIPTVEQARCYVPAASTSPVRYFN